MLALIKDNTIISEIYENSRFELPNSVFVSPAQDGWNNGDYSLLTIQEADPVPDGAIITSKTTELSDGSPRYVYTWETAPIVVPDRVTSRQFMVMLDIMGLYNAVQNWVSTQERKYQLAFQHSGTFVKDEPMMQAGFKALGFTEEQIDQFFTAASQI